MNTQTSILLNKIKKLKAIIDDPETAKRVDRMREEIERWENEVDQMFDDKENRMITVGLCGA